MHRVVKRRRKLTLAEKKNRVKQKKRSALKRAGMVDVEMTDN